MLQPGDVVERYRVELVLGQGGMAVVYRVRHTTLNTVHALKVLQVDHPQVAARLVEEGRVQARLRHPNVVAVTDVFEAAGWPALLMDFVDGGSLDAHIAAAGLSGLPLDRVEAWFRGIVAGVQAAHEAGLVHRDLKPQNILMARETRRGQTVDLPKVADFGIARHLEGTPEGRNRTRMGTALGTPAYMAPEQIRDAANVDPRADLYALGAILYELLTGCQAFVGEDPLAVMNAAAQARFVDPRVRRPGLHGPLVDAVYGCLVVDRRFRVPDCETLLRVLDGEGRALGFLAPTEASQAGADTWGVEGGEPATGPGPGDGSGTWDPDAAPEAPVAEESTGGTASPRAPDTLEEATEQAAELPTSAPSTPPVPAGLPPATRVADTALVRPTAQASRSARARALVTDDTGRGHVIELLVELVEGPQGVWAPEDVARDARVAAQLAVAVALGPEQARRWAVRWAVRGAGGVTLHGSSIGLAVAAAARAALLGRTLPEGAAFTGGVDLDGTVAPVGGVPAKVRAAAEAGMSEVFVPAEATTGAVPEGLRLSPVDRVEELFARILPEVPERRLPWRLAALLLAPLLALAGLSDAPELALRAPLLAAVHGRVPVENVVVVGLDPVSDLRAYRAEYPALLRGLQAAGARVAFLDVKLEVETEADAAIAEAVREVSAAGMPVVLATSFREERPVPPGHAPLAEAVVPGLVELHKDLLFGAVRRAPARLRDVDGGETWHASVQTARGLLGTDKPPRLDGGELVVGALRNPTLRELVLLAPTENPPVVAWDAPETWSVVDDRAVIIGLVGGTLDLHQTSEGPRYGAEIEAGLVETLVAQRVPREVSPPLNALLALLAGAGMVGMAQLLGARRRWLSLLWPGALLAVSLALVAAQVLVGLVPLLVATGIAGWIVRAQPGEGA